MPSFGGGCVIPITVPYCAMVICCITIGGEIRAFEYQRIRKCCSVEFFALTKDCIITFDFKLEGKVLVCRTTGICTIFTGFEISRAFLRAKQVGEKHYNLNTVNTENKALYR